MCTPLWRGTMAVYRFLASAQNKKAFPRKWEFRGDQEISGKMCQVSNEGCDQGDGCLTRDPLPRPAPAHQQSFFSESFLHPSPATLLRCFAGYFRRWSRW